MKPESFAEVVDLNCCRYISGDAGKLIFCEKEIEGHSAYCPEHRALCRRKTPPINLSQTTDD